MRRVVIGVVIGLVLSFTILNMGQRVIAEQSRMQIQGVFDVPSTGGGWIICDTANGNLIYISQWYGGGMAMWGQPNQCAKAQK